LAGHKAVVGIASVLVVGGIVAGSATGVWGRALGKGSGTAALRLLYWRTTWPIIREHPWLGVGPGNFREAYAAHMEQDADEKITDPHNFALEVWVTCGAVAVAALLVAIGAFFVAVAGRSREVAVAGPDTSHDGGEGKALVDEPRLEFYVGG